MYKGKKGMTLIELLAVIAIIAILFILLIPTINSAIEKSRISGVQSDFHSYEVGARSYLMERGNDEKTEEDLNQYLDKALRFESGVAKEKGPWNSPYKIQIDNENKQFIFSTADKINQTHQLIVSWDEEIHSKYVIIGADNINNPSISEEEKNTICESRTIVETDSKYFTVADVEGGVSITAYSNDGPKDVVIPCQINGEYVVSISSLVNGAFQSKGINSIVFPNTLKKIEGKYAMRGNNLEHIQLPSSLEYIGSYAFDNNALQELKLPSNLKFIGERAFSINKIKSLTIPDNVLEISDHSFFKNPINTLVIGSGLTKIPSYSFANTNIENVVIPNNITNIAEYAFYNSNIEKVKIGDNVEIIGQAAFANNHISSLELGSSLKEILNSAFNSNEISKIDFPKSVIFLDQYSFYNNPYLVSVSYYGLLSFDNVFSKNPVFYKN